MFIHALVQVFRVDIGEGCAVQALEQSHRLLILSSRSEMSLSLDLCKVLRTSFSSHQVTTEIVDVDGAQSVQRAFATLIQSHRADIVFVPLSVVDCPGGANILAERAGVPVLVVGQAGDTKQLLAALELGATDFITRPLRASDVLTTVLRALGQNTPHDPPDQSLKATIGLKHLVGQSAIFQKEINKIPIVAKCDANILITGETGTGKELCARSIHYLSSRSYGPFVPVNCGAIPVELVENELFGHEKGAFTGATGAQPGLIHEARGGTLFLDEIDCLPSLAQVKLLRFLQEKEYRPVGSSKLRVADLRVISATNLDVELAVRDGQLRRDLYYRLNVLPLRLPPLRERREDIAVLTKHFLDTYASRFKKGTLRVPADTLRCLELYDWPGNVRELEHVVERAVVLASGSDIEIDDLSLPRVVGSSESVSFKTAKARVIEQFERGYIQKLLLTHRGNISKSAQAAGKNRRAFFELVRKYDIDVNHFRSIRAG